MNAASRSRVRRRARNRCKYCKLHQDDSPLAPLHCEHIIPKAHGGDDALENIALACIDCNLHKGTNLTGIDPETGAVTKIFNPRRHRWMDHFSWRGVFLAGTSSNGQTTTRVLNMNSDRQLPFRYS